MPQFKERPALCTDPDHFEIPFTHSQQAAVDEEMGNFLSNNIVEEVKDLSSPGYYNHIFVRPRKNSTKQWRLIFDMSTLNRFLTVPKFKLESIPSLRNLFNEGEYYCSIDISDAFLHVKINRKFRRYMRFFYRGKCYQFRTISFGASFSPYIFCSLMATCIKFFHKMGIDITSFFDDLLIKARSLETLEKHVKYVLQVLEHLGWIISYKKSQLNGSQVTEYIGAHIDSVACIVKPPEDRFQKILQLTTYFLTLDQAPAKLWASLLGLLTSCQDLTFMGRLYLRPLQVHVNQYWLNRNHLFTPIPVTVQCKQLIAWWQDPTHVLAGVPWRHPPPQETVITDSSSRGFGATCGFLQLSGTWDPQTQGKHINFKELLAVWRALIHWEDLLMNKSVIIASDNQTTITYLNKQGGTKSTELLNLTTQILEIHLSPVQVSSRQAQCDLRQAVQ